MSKNQILKSLKMRIKIMVHNLILLEFWLTIKIPFDTTNLL